MPQTFFPFFQTSLLYMMNDYLRTPRSQIKTRSRRIYHTYHQRKKRSRRPHSTKLAHPPVNLHEHRTPCTVHLLQRTAPQQLKTNHIRPLLRTPEAGTRQSHQLAEHIPQPDHRNRAQQTIVSLHQFTVAQHIHLHDTSLFTHACKINRYNKNLFFTTYFCTNNN